MNMTGTMRAGQSSHIAKLTNSEILIAAAKEIPDPLGGSNVVNAPTVAPIGRTSQPAWSTQAYEAARHMFGVVSMLRLCRNEAPRKNHGPPSRTSTNAKTT